MSISDLEQIEKRFGSSYWMPDSGFYFRIGQMTIMGWNDPGNDQYDDRFHVILQGHYPDPVMSTQWNGKFLVYGPVGLPDRTEFVRIEAGHATMLLDNNEWSGRIVDSTDVEPLDITAGVSSALTTDVILDHRRDIWFVSGEGFIIRFESEVLRGNRQEITLWLTIFPLVHTTHSLEGSFIYLEDGRYSVYLQEDYPGGMIYGDITLPVGEYNLQHGFE